MYDRPKSVIGLFKFPGSRAEKLVVVLQGKKTYRMELPEARWNALQPGQSVSAVIRGGWSVLELHP